MRTPRRAGWARTSCRAPRPRRSSERFSRRRKAVADSPQTDQSASGFRVVMFADFICPYCYIGQERMEQLARDYDVRPQWRPYWLHPETPPEGAPFPQNADRERARTTFEWLQEMAPEKAAR